MNDVLQPPEPVVTIPEEALALAGRTLVQERARSIRKVVGRRLGPTDIVLRQASPEVSKHLFDEACELYWNELSWEEITDEEIIGGDGELTEMVFPGLLTLINAFLPRAANGEPDRDREHRDVAHDFLDWLGARLVQLRETKAESQDDRATLLRRKSVTDDLIDLIAFRIYSLAHDEIEAYQRA